MNPASKILQLALIRAIKSMLTAWEEWIKAQSGKQ